MSFDASLNETSVVVAARHGDLTTNGVLVVSNGRLATLVCCLVVTLIASQRLQMNIERQLAVASVRCFVQLCALGLVLVPIIMYNYAPLVLAYIAVMMFVAAVEAASRPAYTFDSIVVVCFVSITSTVAVFGTFTFVVVLGTGLDAQYAIPITGMITGTAMSTVSVAVSNLVTEFAERKANIELLLALGATRWEAARESIRASVILGLTPILNTLSVTGLVSIPGMMTGQIIGGTPPGLAAKYQLVIMYVAAGASTVSTLLASILTVYALIDSEYRIRGEKLYAKGEVNRIEAMLKTMHYVASSLLQWREAVRRNNSPFPPYTTDPLPAFESAVPNSSAPSKAGRAHPAYGATTQERSDS